MAHDIVRPKFYCSTTQFVCIGAFHAKISDPVIGGTYITVRVLCVHWTRSLVEFWQLLNTVSNLGSTWPRFFVLRGTTACNDHHNYLTPRTAIDFFTIASCEVDGDNASSITKGPSTPDRAFVLADAYLLQGLSASPRREEPCVLPLQGRV
jgi:acetyl-CoA transporter-like protein